MGDDTRVNIDGELVILGQEALLLHAAELDNRRQEQIKRQADIITRLCGDQDGAARILELASELSDKTWQLAKIRESFKSLVGMMNRREDGDIHVVSIQEVLDLMREILQISGPLEQIQISDGPKKYALGKRKSGSEE